MQSEKHILAYLVTKDELENLQILTEVLIFVGILIACTLTSVMAVTVVQKIVTLACGGFIWGHGIWLRVKLRKAIKGID